MPKNKLKKFTEINSFPNVIQHPVMHDSSFHFPNKGKWSESFFENSNQLILEIGCGKGEYTLALGRTFPGINFIGIDIKGDRIWKGAKDALEAGVHNVAFLRTQAEHINSFFAQEEVSGIWLTFPDPQEKQIRAKKRLTSPHFLEKYYKLLVPGSPINLKTDNKQLFDYTLAVIDEGKHHLLACSYDIYNDNSINEPILKEVQTYYESIYLKQGKTINYLKFSLNENRR